MSRGRAFICWLDGCVPLYQGGEVEFRLKRRWWRGTIHCRKGCYKFRRGKREFWVLFRFNLRPVTEARAEGTV